MAEPYSLTFGQIQTRVMEQLRLPTNNITVSNQVLAVVNEVYRDICAKQDWWWLLKHVAINTKTFDTFPTVKTTALVTISLDGLTVTLDSTSFPTDNFDLTNWVMIVPSLATDPSAVFRIASYNSTLQQFTLDAPFTGEDTDQLTPNQITVSIYQDSIPLPSDVAKLLQVRRYGRLHPMERLGIEDMMKLKEYDQTTGSPEVYSIYDAFFTGLSGLPTASRMLQIHPYPDHQYRLDVFYKLALTTDLSANTIPLVPSDYLQTLIYGTLSRAYPVFVNDTERGAYYMTLFNNLMDVMASQQKEYAKDQSGIRPDMNGYRRMEARRRPRTAWTLGRYFDTLPNIP